MGLLTAVYGRLPPQAVIGPRFTAGPANARNNPRRRFSGGGGAKTARTVSLTRRKRRADNGLRPRKAVNGLQYVSPCPQSMRHGKDDSNLLARAIHDG